MKLFIEFEISYFNKSISKSHSRKSLLDDSFCDFSNKGEINSFAKWLIGSVGCLYRQPTITLVGSEQIISIKVYLIFPRSSILRSFLSWKKSLLFLWRSVPLADYSVGVCSIEQLFNWRLTGLDESFLILDSVIARMSKLTHLTHWVVCQNYQNF